MLGEGRAPHAIRRRIEKLANGADREDHHETTGISQGGGRRARDVHDRGAGHRPIDARAEMAVDGELAEVARHALWRARIHGQADRRTQREQVSDPSTRRASTSVWNAARSSRHDPPSISVQALRTSWPLAHGNAV